jgi:uncharacterized protein (DUF427 family)
MSDRVTLEPMKRIKVVLRGETIAETSRGFVVHEKGLDDRYYVPRADVQAKLTDTTDTGHCPWKGEWRHVDVEAAGVRVPSGAWSYYDPKPVTEPIRDFVAFYANKMDRIETA